MKRFDEAWFERRVAEFKASLDRDFPNAPDTNRFLAERRVWALIENEDEEVVWATETTDAIR